MLELDSLVKRFRDVLAVDGVSFKVAAGESVALLGPNGAGKTTTLSMIAGLLTPDSGHVRISGRPLQGDADLSKQSLGLVPQEIALYDELSADQNLRLFGTLTRGSSRGLAGAIDRVLDLVGLKERRGDKVKAFSGGMKRRLNLAATLLHDPKLLLLDEPTVGVDPQSRLAIFENLETLRRNGTALLYSTHYMEEAERLCDRVVILDHGKVLMDETLQSLRRRLPAQTRVHIELLEPVDESWLPSLRQSRTVLDATVDLGQLSVELREISGLSDVLEVLRMYHQSYSHLASERPNLESVFLNLTGRSLRD